MMKKSNGSIAVEATIIFSIVLVLILVAYTTTLSIVRTEAEMTSDDVISSELAVYKDINLDELGKSDGLDKIIFTNYEEAFGTFKKYLKINLNLQEDFTPKNSQFSFIKGKVKIETFIIYNVDGNNVQKITCTEVAENNNGKSVVKFQFNLEDIPNGVSTVKTPKGNSVEHTTIYAKIGFNINKGFRGLKQYVTVEEESDILKE